MALGSTPLIPMYRALPDPNARSDRFGQNNAQLFGKPMISAGGVDLFASAYGTAKAGAGSRQEAASVQAPEAAKATSGTLGTQIDLKV